MGLGAPTITAAALLAVPALEAMRIPVDLLSAQLWRGRGAWQVSRGVQRHAEGEVKSGSGGTRHVGQP